MRWFLIPLIFMLLFHVLARMAIAHEAPTGWSYDPSCCNTTDCRPADGPYGKREHNLQIREVAEGFLVVRPSGVEPYGTDLVKWGDRRLRQSKDNEYHVCTTAGMDNGYVLCIYVPHRGF